MFNPWAMQMQGNETDYYTPATEGNLARGQDMPLPSGFFPLFLRDNSESSSEEEKEGKILESVSQTAEEKDSMEAKTQQQEIQEEKIQTQIDEAATKMSGIDVRLDKMQDASQEIPFQPKDAKALNLQAYGNW
uniref:Uncharacterized protein n=1 Tax=Romanomermis culicivorax TaxID=13658 RepID=A0A915JN62_ROMCU